MAKTTFILLLVSLCGAIGCETVSVRSTASQPPLPKPIAAPITPESAPITDVVVICPYSMSDMNGNGQNREFPIAVYLYAQPHPAPKWVEGSCELSLYPMNSLFGTDPEDIEMVGKWKWSASEVQLARKQNIVGDFYRFEIDLWENKVSVEDTTKGFDFLIVFTPRSNSGLAPHVSGIKAIRTR